MVNARPAANLNNRCYELDASVIAAIKVELCTLQRAAGPRGLRGPRPRLSLPLRSTGHQWDARPKTQFRRRLAAGGRVSCELVSENAKFPASWEYTGNFIDSGLGGASMAAKNDIKSVPYGPIP